MVQHWSIYLWVGLGSGLGGIGRLWVFSWMHHRFGVEFPWGTLTVNVIGSFVIGCFAAFTLPESRWILHPRFSLFFMAGFCGGFTTFSSFSMQTLELLQRGAWGYAVANMFSSLLLCLAAVAAGYYAGLWLNR